MTIEQKRALIEKLAGKMTENEIKFDIIRIDIIAGTNEVKAWTKAAKYFYLFQPDQPFLEFIMNVSTRISAAQAARKLMEALSQLRLRNDSAFWSTSEVLKASGLSPTARGQQLKVLTRLYNRGLINRSGKGQFSWRLEKAYDPADLGNFGEVDGGDDQAPAKPVVRQCKCKGTGQWVNPNNPADVRPCFYCQGDKARDHQDSKDAEAILALMKIVGELSVKVDTLEKAKRAKMTIEVTRGGEEIKKLKDVTVPDYFEELVDLALAGENIMLVGPAGCGKTFVAQLLADTIDRNFFAISCTAGMSEVHLIGRSVPNLKTGKSVFQGTAFLDAYENGGVFLLDEIDAADANLMMVLNAALSNGYCNVPNREDNPVAKMHPNFVCIAAANTYGRGADRQYVGRNQLDASTLDRFAIGIIECDYDRTVESAICPDTDLLNNLWKLREAVVANGLRRFISTRFVAKAAKMAARDWTWERIKGKAQSGWSADEIKRVNNLA